MISQSSNVVLPKKPIIETLMDQCIKVIVDNKLFSNQLPKELKERIGERILNVLDKNPIKFPGDDYCKNFPTDTTNLKIENGNGIIASAFAILCPEVKNLEISATNEFKVLPENETLNEFQKLKDLKINWPIYEDSLKHFKKLICTRKIKVHLTSENHNEIMSLCMSNINKYDRYRNDNNSIYKKILNSLIKNGQFNEIELFDFIVQLRCLNLQLQIEIINLIIDIEKENIMKPLDTNKNTILHILALQGCGIPLLSILNKLPNLEDKNALNKSGYTPLDMVELSMILNRDDVFEKMIEQGYKRSED